MQDLIRKGWKSVDRFMTGRGYQLWDVYEMTGGYSAEYYKSGAGIVLEKVEVYFNEKMKCTGTNRIK